MYWPDYNSLLTQTSIWNIRQNSPRLIARDFAVLGIPEATTHTILLARGVYKWLAARRDIIQTKDRWKDRVNETLVALKQAKAEGDAFEIGYLRGYLKGIEECRAEVRAICHSDRWRAPDNDKEAQAFLRRLEEENGSTM